MRGGSLFVLLEPRCSKWRGAYKLSSGELSDLSFPTLRVPPFISQGGVSIYIFLSWSLEQVGDPSSGSIGRSHTTGRAWRGCVRLDFLGNGSSRCRPIRVNRDSLLVQSGVRRSSPRLVIRDGSSRPSFHSLWPEDGVMEWWQNGHDDSVRDGAS